jgi:long-chain acyl-CoA synthetase
VAPGHFVTTSGDKPAVVMGATKRVVTYRELDDNSKRFAQLLRDAGLQPADHIAVLMENNPRYFEVVLAAHRSGLYVTPINWHLKPDEAGYIVADSDARVLVTSRALADVAVRLEPYLAGVGRRLAVDGDVDGYERYETAIRRFPARALDNEIEGLTMYYSSGTTGRPKGVEQPFTGEPFGSSPGRLVTLIQQLFGFSSDTVYLCPAPLYHAAPLGWSTAVHRMGGTVIVMERFDAHHVLQLIEEHRVTHAQFVPTHFVRMLKLPDDQRLSADLSSLQKVIHAAAPCPVEVKQRMIQWWGPIIYEYYAGSEGNGFCTITPEEWLAHPGSVGRSLLGTVHILDEDGVEQPAGHPGQIWFESDARFTYHNDPDKTAKAFNERGWSSLGDLGYLDDEGYLYLTDRASHMIISGGVNIYPQEVENQLTLHPAVCDVAVIGVPNADLGEEVKAVVVAADPGRAGDTLAGELIAYCRERLAHYKCPVSVDFVDELPRLPTGKLLKRELRSRYWAR